MQFVMFCHKVLQKVFLLAWEDFPLLMKINPLSS